MSLCLSPKEPESSSRSILHWRESVTSHTTVLEKAQKASVIADFVERCLETYSKVLANLTTRKEPQDFILCSLRSSRDYLVLWADENGVRDGNLDDILDLSRRLHALTVRLLIKIGEILVQRLLPKTLDAPHRLATDGERKVTKCLEHLKLLAQGSSNQDSDSDTEDSLSDPEKEETSIQISQISQSLQVTVGCLFGMGSRLNNRAMKRTEELSSKPIETTQWHASVPLIERIRNRYPECKIDLATRLGKANWRRIQERRKRIDENEQSQGPGEPSTLLDLDRDPDALEKTVLAPTLHDSGIGTSVPSAPSQRAETVVSYDGVAGGSIRVPPLPKEVRPCVGCGQMVRMSNMVKWKKHLFEDLQPYICLYDDCESNVSPFQTKDEWLNHFLVDHARDGEHFECPLCKSHEPVTSMSILKHVSRHLEEIALTALPIDCEQDEELSGHVSQGSPQLGLFPDPHSFRSSDPSPEPVSGSGACDLEDPRNLPQRRYSRKQENDDTRHDLDHRSGVQSPWVPSVFYDKDAVVPTNTACATAPSAGSTLPAGQSSSPRPNTSMTPQIHQTFVSQLHNIENQIRQSHPNTPQEVVRQMATRVLQSRHNSLTQSAMNAAAGGQGQAIANVPHQYAQLLRAQQQAQAQAAAAANAQQQEQAQQNLRASSDGSIL